MEKIARIQENRSLKFAELKKKIKQSQICKEPLLVQKTKPLDLKTNKPITQNIKLQSTNVVEVKPQENKQNKKVIYTCITGGYDDLKEPIIINKDFDYVCFTDDATITSKVWKITYIENTDNLPLGKFQRYYKMLPHKILNEYDLSVYVDGNILLNFDVEKFINGFLDNKHHIFLKYHPVRTCAYKEVEACVKAKKDNEEIMRKQINRYQSEGFPSNFGLSENNFMVRYHNEKDCVDLMEMWFDELKKESGRDQLSLQYCIWKTNTQVKYFKGINNLKPKPHIKKKTYGKFSSSAKKQEDIVNKTVNAECPYSLNPKDYEDKFIAIAQRHRIQMNLNNPQTIQEKMAWLNFNNPMKLKTKCADKILLHEYCKETLGEDVCIPILKTYNSTNEINWDELPQKFVIKCNHGSGMNIIVKDKSALNIHQSIGKLDKWMEDDFAFRNAYEMHYHDIPHKIFVEEYKETSNSSSLLDYKFWCCNGEPKLYTINDGIGHGDIMYYKMDGSEYNLYNVKKHDNYKKPQQFDLMVEYAKKLAKPFKFVRIDMYEIDNVVYLGEMTFMPGACMFKYKKDEDNYNVGKLLDLGIEDKKQIQLVSKITTPINFLTIHYNTPKLTSCLVKNLNKLYPNCKIFIFDNSDKKPFVNTFDNVTIFDNTKGKIIDFNKWLENYPNRHKSLGKHSNFGSAKHCKSVDIAMNLINDNFVLLDSDILLTKPIDDFIQEDKIFVGEIMKWGWGLIGNRGSYPETSRIKPFICFINNKMCKEKNITYFNDNFMAGLYNPNIEADSWDTGGYFWKEASQYDYATVLVDDYMVHFGGGSYRIKGSKEHLTPEQWINKYQYLIQ